VEAGIGCMPTKLNPFSRFDAMLVTDGRTDKQTDAGPQLMPR